jgi:glucosylglycerate synthase
LVDETFLTDDFVRELMNVGEVDILIGVPTHNNAKTIEPVIQAIQAGILKCFPRERAAIINADGGSRDGTPDLFAGATISDVRHASKLYTLRTLHSFSASYGDAPDAGMALRTILAASELLRAKACVVISPDSASVEPEWVQHLSVPIYKDNFDFVAPLYKRHKFEGLLMRNLLYPMTRAIYGYDIREPYASDFALSDRLVTDFLGSEIWDNEFDRINPEICLTMRAIAGNFQVCQSFLGTKAPHDSAAPDLVAAMRRTAGVLFASIDKQFPTWSTNSSPHGVKTFGPATEINLDPVSVDRKRMYEIFATGVAELQPVFRSILSPATLADLQRVAAASASEFKYTSELWAKTAYEFAASYHKSVINRDHIIQALVPLYRGRTLSFICENENSSAEQIESSVESQCLEFERHKPYLLQVWNGGK